jgi:hypothetical protein
MYEAYTDEACTNKIRGNSVTISGSPRPVEEYGTMGTIFQQYIDQYNIIKSEAVN